MCLVLTLAAAATVTATNRRSLSARQASTTRAAVEAIDRRLSAYVDVLRATAAMVEVKGSLSRPEFARYMQTLDVTGRYAGVKVIGVAEEIRVADLGRSGPQIDRDASAADPAYPPFHVHPVPRGPTALPIDYLYPPTGNEKAFGLDLYSEAHRRAAATRARDTGEPTASAPVTLVQETEKQQGFLIMIPLYAQGAPTSTVAQRRAAFTGVVYAAFRTGDLMHGVAGTLTEADTLDVADTGAVVDGTFVPSPVDPLYSHGRTVTSEAADVGPNANERGTLDVSGRRWSVHIETASSRLGPVEARLPAIVLVLGLVFAGLLGWLVTVLGISRARALATSVGRASELRAIFEAASEGIISIDEEGVIRSWNTGAADMFGHGLEVVGQPLEVLVPARNHEARDSGPTRLGVGDGSQRVGQTVQLTAVRADGSEFPVELSLSAWTSEEGRFHTAIVRDITDRVCAQEQLQDTTRLLSSVLQAATEVSIIGTDVDGLITVFNAGAERMLGYRADDIVGRHTPEVIHDPDEVVARACELGIEPGFEVFVTAARRGDTETREWTYVRQDGSTLLVELTVTAMRRAGTVSGYIGIARDITERRRIESEKDHLQEHLRLLLESSAQGIYGLDRDGFCTFVNGVAAEMFGWSREELLGQNMHDLVHHSTPDGQPYPVDSCGLMAAVRAGRAGVRTDEVFWRRNGQPIPVEYATGPIIRNGTADGAVVTFTDISARLAGQAAQRAALQHERDLVQRLQELDRTRDAFVSTVSHELRTPLTCILGYLDLMTGGGPLDDQDRAEMLDVVQSSSRQLLVLVDDLLTLSRVEEGVMDLAPAPLDVVEVLRGACAALPPAHGRRLEVSLPPGPGVHSVMGDELQLPRAFLNLLTNAVKFTPDGGRIDVAARVDGPEIVVTIADTGIGIPTSEQGQLFSRFFRSSISQGNQTPGTGLGLVIVAGIVKGHGGTIHVESQEGQGTTVEVRLPLAADPGPRPDQAPDGARAR